MYIEKIKIFRVKFNEKHTKFSLLIIFWLMVTICNLIYLLIFSFIEFFNTGQLSIIMQLEEFTRRTFYIYLLAIVAPYFMNRVFIRVVEREETYSEKELDEMKLVYLILWILIILAMVIFPVLRFINTFHFD